jgi:hypothetical protein
MGNHYPLAGAGGSATKLGMDKMKTKRLSRICGNCKRFQAIHNGLLRGVCEARTAKDERDPDGCSHFETVSETAKACRQYIKKEII